MKRDPEVEKQRKLHLAQRDKSVCNLYSKLRDKYTVATVFKLNVSTILSILKRNGFNDNLYDY